MPYKSQAQKKMFFAKESKGELPKGTAKRWAKHTPDMKKLPEHKTAAVSSPAEVDTFVKAAMSRYAELGVPRDIAEDLFARKMTKIAEQLGLAAAENPSVRIVKAAQARLVSRGIPMEQARVMLSHEFSKRAFIDKVARVKTALLTHIKAAATPQDTDVDAMLADRKTVTGQLKPKPKAKQ